MDINNDNDIINETENFNIKSIGNLYNVFGIQADEKLEQIMDNIENDYEIKDDDVSLYVDDDDSYDSPSYDDTNLEEIDEDIFNIVKNYAQDTDIADLYSPEEDETNYETNVGDLLNDNLDDINEDDYNNMYDTNEYNNSPSSYGHNNLPSNYGGHDNNDKDDIVLNSVIENMGYGKTTNTSTMMDENKMEEYKTRLLIEIDQLYNELTDYNPEEIKPEVNQNSSLDEIKRARNILVTKCEVYCAKIMSEEVLIFFGQNIIEKIFNGKNSFFGKKPNLNGWTQRQLIPKIRRTNFGAVREVQKVYNGLNTPMKFIIEVFLSMFNYGYNNMGSDIGDISDFEYRQSMNNL